MKKETKKKMGSLIIAGTIALSGVGLDKIGSNKIKEYVGILDVKAEDYNTQKVAVYINNERTEFDVEPSIINDRVMVPMRKIFESLGATINYNNETKTITGVTEEGHTLEHKIGSNTIKIDNKELKFDTNSLVKNDRTLVPIRFVGESLGADVYYYDDENKPTLESKTRYVNIPKKSVDIIKDRPKINNDKHAAIKETINNNPNLTATEKNFYINEMEEFYKDNIKYISNYVIERNKKFRIEYRPELKGIPSSASTIMERIQFCGFSNFEELLKRNDKPTAAHEYYHMIQGTDVTGYIFNYHGVAQIVCEGGAAILEDEYFNGISYGYCKNIFRLFCELLGSDVMGYFNLGGNFRIFKAELLKYLKTTEEVDKFCEILSIIGNADERNEEKDQNNLNEFYKYVKKIYENKNGMEIENDILMTAYLDFACRTNRLGMTPINEGYDVYMVGVEGINYYTNETTSDKYIVWVNEILGTDINTFYFGRREYSLNERYIDKSKVKKLIK